MAKQLNVNLAFTADTGKAKAQIQDLQNQLTKLVTTTNNQKFSVDLDSKGINEAISSVAELQAHLSKATNQKTGHLDFSNLNDSLKKSNKSFHKVLRLLTLPHYTILIEKKQVENYKKKKPIYDRLLLLCQRRPIFPRPFGLSIVGITKLNYRVRNGNGCTLRNKDTDWCTFRDSNPGPTD